MADNEASSQPVPTEPAAQVIDYANLAHWRGDEAPPPGCQMTLKPHSDQRGLTVIEIRPLKESMGDIVAIPLLTLSLFVTFCVYTFRGSIDVVLLWVFFVCWLPCAWWAFMKTFANARKPRSYIVREGDLTISPSGGRWVAKWNRWPRDQFPRLQVDPVTMIAGEKQGILYVACDGKLRRRVSGSRRLNDLMWLAQTLNTELLRTSECPTREA